MSRTRLAIIADYDWATWFVGIIRAFIAGGAGAIAAPLGPMVQDPGDYNLGGGLHKVLVSMGIVFLITGIAGMGIFLKTHGAPDKVQQSLTAAAAANVKAGDAIADAQKSAAK